jgi:hypothetical protein
MKYRVAFMERTDGEGNRSEVPTEYVELDLVDGVVIDQNFVERIEPDALHGIEQMEEDDSFESIGTEVWEGRDQEFVDALKNSGLVMEYDVIDDVDLIEPGKAEA